MADALRRAATYRVLAAAFAYPTHDRLSELARRAADAVVATPSSRLAGALARLAAAAATSDAAVLAGEYLGLFDGAVRCPPYEGAWGPQQITGKAALLADIAGFYTAFGVTPAVQHADIEDHAGAELEFMSVLALKEAYALAEERAEAAAITREAQAKFVAEHLGRWGEAFAARVQALAAPGFYPAAAALLATWITEECGSLAVAPSKVDTPSATPAAPFTCPMAAAETEGTG